MNIIAFADDLVILAPNSGALQEILGILGKLLSELNLNFNVIKTVCMHLSRKPAKNNVKPNIYINSHLLMYVKQLKYLGFIVDEDMSDKSDIIKCRNKFYSVFNVLLRKFHFLDQNAFFELFKSYCLQMYGPELWFSSSRCNQLLHKFSVGFHKAIKKVWKCPNYVSNTFLCNHINILKFKNYINWTKIRFLFNIYKSKNRLIRTLSDHFKFRSMFVKDTCNILKSEYDIENPFDNDLEAIKARIMFVQIHEPHSMAFTLL